MQLLCVLPLVFHKSRTSAEAAGESPVFPGFPGRYEHAPSRCDRTDAQ